MSEWKTNVLGNGIMKCVDYDEKTLKNTKKNGNEMRKKRIMWKNKN